MRRLQLPVRPAPVVVLPLAVLLTILLTILLAGLFWATFWHQSQESVLTRVPTLDEAWYLGEAPRLRAEGGWGRQPFVMSPGYTLLVAASGASAPDEQGVLRHHPRALLAWQAVAWLACGLVGGGLVARVGLRSGCRPVEALGAAVVTALLWWLYQPAAIYARLVLLEVSLVLAMTIALAVATGGGRPTWWRPLAAGLALGLGALLRAQVLVVALPLAIVFWRTGGSRRRRLLATGGLLVLVLMPPGLASWHNSRLSAEPAGPSLNAGLNLYLGQTAGTGGLFTSLEGFDQARQPSGADYLAERLGRPVEGPAAADAVWRQEAWRLVEADPWRAVRGWLRKMWLHLQAWEIAQVTPLTAWPDTAPVLRWLVVPWGLLVLAGLLGTAAALSRPTVAAGDRGPRVLRSTASVWAAAGLLLIAAQSLFFVISRYRLTLAMILAVLAGLGLVAGLHHWRTRRWRGLTVPLVALPVIVALLVPWNLGETRQQWSALEAANLGRRLAVLAAATEQPQESARLRDRAEALLGQAVAGVPDRVDLWRLRAANLAAGGPSEAMLEAALEVLATGIRSVADPTPLLRQRIVLLREAGRFEAAEAAMRQHLRERPHDPDLHHDLVVLLGRQGRWDEAATAARALQVAAPHDHRGWLDLGVALARLGRPDEAAAVLEEGLGLFPDEPARSQLLANLRRLEAPASGAR